MFNYLDPERKQIERKKQDTCLILHDAVTLLTTLLVFKIKMATQRYHDWRFQVSCKAFFSGKSPYTTLRVRIYCLLYLKKAFFFYELWDFPQIVRSDAIWGQMCKIALSHNIRSPAIEIHVASLSHLFCLIKAQRTKYGHLRDLPKCLLNEGDIGGYPILQYREINVKYRNTAWKIVQIPIPHILITFIIGSAYLWLLPSSAFNYLRHLCTRCPCFF